MASKKQQLETLQRLSLFSACTKKELERVLRAGDEISMTEGTVIIEEGQTGREAFVVLDGSVIVKRNNRKVATLEAGSMVGELSLLDHGPRTASAVCATDCSLLVIEQRRFQAVLEDVPSLTKKLLATLATRLRDIDTKYYG